MTLRSKTLITISITIVLLVGILYVSAQYIILNSFKQLEIQNTQQVVKSALNVHSQNVTQLRDRFADWASWDDAYLFVTDSNQAFITSNLTEASLSTLSNNVMIFTDSTEKMVWGTGYNIKTGLIEPIPEDINGKIGKGDLLFYRQSAHRNDCPIRAIPVPNRGCRGVAHPDVTASPLAGAGKRPTMPQAQGDQVLELPWMARRDWEFPAG